MIIPARFLKTIKRTGLGKSLFYTLRYDEDGGERKDFVLNKPAYKDAEILVTGSNFVAHPGSMRGPWMISASVVLLPRTSPTFSIVTALRMAFYSSNYPRRMWTD